MHEQRRVVVTGLGLISPLGTGVDKNWQCLDRRAIGHQVDHALCHRRIRLAHRRRGAGFQSRKILSSPKRSRRWIFSSITLWARRLWRWPTAVSKSRVSLLKTVGVIIGVGLCGLDTIETTKEALLSGGPRKISPFFIPKVISNLAPGHVAIRFGAKGVNWTPTSACASGTHAIGEAFHLIQRGLQDAVIAGGAESAITPLAVGGFAAMKALSTRNDEPERASRPFDKERDGFVIGEGPAC